MERKKRGQELHETLTLWACQREAVQATVRYCEHFDRLDPNSARPSMVVCMPTGSGKTAVIGTLARCVPQFGTVVIISPRVSVADQLYREVSGRLFEKLGADPSVIPKQTIRPVRPFGAELDDKDLNNLVVFLTVQQLQRWHAEDHERLRRLREATTLLLFDEGHYEPAPSWSETVREFPAPRVVFTATPYRNDFRLFQADTEKSYFYSFEQAVEDNVIRDVSFHALEGARNPRAFIERLIEVFQEEIGEIESTDDRIIIRCDSLESIHHLKRAVEAQGLPCLAIHEKIVPGAANDEFRHVPNPQDVDARVWIHQFKLIEGVDDPRFRLIGIYDGFGSVRAVVQQVGRVTRNPRNRPGEKAYVLDGSGRNLEEAWKNYRDFDASVRENGYAVIAPEQRLVEALAKALPGVVYLGQQFRRVLDLNDFVPENGLQLPCSAVINHLNSRKFDIEIASDIVVNDLTEADRFVSKPIYSEDGNGFIILSVRVGNSRLLTKEYFLEPKLAVTLIRKARRFFCAFDSLGYRPTSCPGMGRRVESRLLRRLLAEGDGDIVTGVDLVNSSVSGQSLRTKSLSARAIGDVPEGFDDHAYVTRHAFGFAGASAARRHRHLGFARARVRDGGSKYVSYSQYLDWLDSVCKKLGSRSTIEYSALDRFARPLDKQPDPEPRGVLLDLAWLNSNYVVNGADFEPEAPDGDGDIPPLAEDGDQLDVEDLAASVDANGVFQVQANGVVVDISIRWDPDRGLYELQSRELARRYRPVEADEPNLLEALNHDQSFRVVPREPGVVYAHGEFYAPRIQFGPDQESTQRTLFRCVRPYPCLINFSSEKGREGVLPAQAGWESESLFGLVDALVKDTPPADLPEIDDGLRDRFTQTKLLVCDDMGTELADFVMLQEDSQGRRRIAFIHAKAKNPDARSLVSASALNEVCGQAVKNLAEMAQYQGTVTDRSTRWNGPWMRKDDPNWTVRNRIRKAPQGLTAGGVTPGAGAWSLVREYVEDPLCEREVWLLTSNILSHDTLLERVTENASPPLETVQAVYCIYSTMTAAASANTRLYILCNQ